MTKREREVFDDAEAFRRAAAGKKPKQRPRVPAGEGDKHAALMRLAVRGISMRFDTGVGFYGWHAATGRRYAAHDDYAAAVQAAERGGDT